MELRSAALSADDGTPDKNLKKKKIRESKNRKKYWKKADITEVEDFLEEKRFDERIGGDVSLRADEEIYLLDKSTDETSERAFQKKRSDILKEPLRCTQVLRQRSKVAVPLKTNQGRPDDARKSQLQLKREQKVTEKRLRQSDSTVSKRKQLKETEASKVQFRTLNSKTEVYDMWDSSVTQPKEVKKTETGNHIDVLEKPPDAEFLTDDQLAYYSKVTRTSRPKIPALRFKKPSLLPSVEVAKPGASYKPSFEDHQALLSEAHEVEVKKVKQGEHLERVLLNLFPTKEEARAIRVKNEVDEAAGILYSDDESEDLADDANAYTTGNPPVRAENRKTRLQRNRQKAHKERETLTKLKKSEKKLDSQFNRIGVFKKEIKKSQKATEEKKKQREVKKQEAMYLPKKLGPQKFAEPDIEIKLTDELAPSLRQLKPEGSLMVDRMRSLEKRNLIEPRRKTIRKKKWTKIVYKRHYKKGAEDVLTNPKTD